MDVMHMMDIQDATWGMDIIDYVKMTNVQIKMVGAKIKIQVCPTSLHLWSMGWLWVKPCSSCWVFSYAKMVVIVVIITRVSYCK